MKKKALLITGFLSANSSQSIRYHNIFESFSNVFDFYHLTFDSFESNLLGITNISLFNSKQKNKIFYYHIIRRIAKRFRNIFFFPDEYIIFLKKYKREIINLKLLNNFELIIIGMTPFSFLKLGNIIKNLFPDIYLIADISDPFSANAEVILRSVKYQNKCFRFENEYLKTFNKLIVINDKIKEYYSYHFNFPKQKIAVIEQGIDRAFFLYPSSIINKKNGKIKLIYAGGFYQGFREPFELYQVIEKSELDLNLIIYGAIHNKYKALNSKKILYKGILPQESLLKEYQKAEIIVVIDNFYGIQIPGKILEVLALNKPVLFIYENEESPSHYYIEKSYNVYKTGNNKKEIEDAINRILNSKPVIGDLSFLNEFTWEALAKKYVSFLEN
jgi:hypothetical protein